MKRTRLAMGLGALAAAGLFAGCTATSRTDTTTSLTDSTTMSSATTTGSSATTTVDSSAQATYQDRGNMTSPPTGSTSSAATTTHGTTHGTSATGSMSGSSSTHMGHSDADMKAMCDMHDRVTRAKTEAEREAALDANVRAMAPAEKKKYIDMMHKHCK